MRRVRSRLLHPRGRLAEITLVVLIGLFCWAPASSEPLPSEENGVPVALIQAALETLGHYAGPLDGRSDRETRAALSSWQESAGLEGTGELTRDQQLALLRESAAGGLAEARELLETLGLPLEEPEPPPPSESERINTLETTLEGFDQRLKTASDGIDANSQALADLGSRLDSELEKVDTVALRLDSLGAQLEESNKVLEEQKSRLEDNSVKLYETLMGIESTKKDLDLVRRAYNHRRPAPAAADAPDTAEDADTDPFGRLLPLVLCFLVPLALVVNQEGPRSSATDAPTEVKRVAWILVAWFAGGAGFFLIGVGIMYGPSLGAVIGNPAHFLGTAMLSAPVELPPELLEVLIPHLILASIVAVVACSGASRALRNRGHLLVALVTGALVYPLFGHWIAMPTDISEHTGWLAGASFECPAATTDVALLGGALALSLASGLGLVRIGSTAGAQRPEPAGTGTTGAMLLWISWVGVMLAAGIDSLSPSVLLLGLGGAAGGAALGVLLVDGATTQSRQWQNRLPFAVLAGIVTAPVGAQEATFIEVAGLGALAGVSASLLMRFLDTRSSADLRLTSALLVGGISGTMGPAMFGSTGFLFVRSIDVLVPQLQGMGAALLLGLVAGRALAWPIGSTRFLRTPT